ncbi:MAG TPA: hypothetical protein VN759_02195, partial [Pseudolysinimonas sp.]|nr:hypothetical protein [Pseudolysinimonas sp.]
VRERSRVIAAELLGMKGFIGFVGATIGDRLLTITAWEGPDDPKQVMKNSTHAEATGKFHSAGQTLGGGGFTSVFVPERINTMWVRCPSCQKMADRAATPDTCGCGAALPAPFPYW